MKSPPSSDPGRQGKVSLVALHRPTFRSAELTMSDFGTKSRKEEHEREIRIDTTSTALLWKVKK